MADEGSVSAAMLVLELQTEDGDWPEGVAERVDEIAAAIVALAEFGDRDAAATIVMSNDERVRGLNARFRGKNAPTNVLSFPSPETGPKTGPVTEPEPGQQTRDSETRDADREPEYLGDVILAGETVRREAEAQAKPISAHALHLIVHGILHLLGYDHETDEDAAIMEALEVRILERLGVPDPYAEELFGNH